MRLEAMIEDCAKRGGWIIFYTHGVQPQPDPYGITPLDLNWLAATCRSAGGEILTVQEARTRLLAEE